MKPTQAPAAGAHRSELRKNLHHARGHIVFLAGLAAAFGIIIGLDAVGTGDGLASFDAAEAETETLLAAGRAAPRPAPYALRPDQLGWGRTAWRFFVNNTDAGTGLPGAVDRFAGVTAWEMGSYLNAAVAAQRIGLIERAELDARVEKALASLERLPLFRGLLPNKSYDVRNLAMTDYDGRPSQTGIGWSALDIARLLIALEILGRGYPEHGPAIARVKARWQLESLLSEGLLKGLPAETTDQPVQEGRLGYEEYAAKGLVLAGYDAYRALETSDSLRLVEVEGVQVPADQRLRERHGADVCITSEPHVMEGLELGFDERSRAHAWAVLQAQARRYAATGVPTAVSENHVPVPPHFVYGCVLGNGAPWAVLSPKGERFDQLRFLDTKAAFAWSVLFPTPYTSTLLKAVSPLNDRARGWLAGRFETGRPNEATTANTNALVLESLHYQAFGPLLRPQLHAGQKVPPS